MPDRAQCIGASHSRSPASPLLAFGRAAASWPAAAQVLRVPRTALASHVERLSLLPSRDITVSRDMPYKGAAVLLMRQLASSGAAYAVAFSARSCVSLCQAIACLGDSLRGLEGLEVFATMEVQWVVLDNGTRLKVRHKRGHALLVSCTLPAGTSGVAVPGVQV